MVTVWILIIHKAKKTDEVVQWIFYGYLVITFEIQKISIYGQPYPMLYMEIKITTCEFSSNSSFSKNSEYNFQLP